MKKTIDIFIIAFLLLSAFSGDAQIIYVAPNASGSGSSWAEATGDLRATLNSALPSTQIWVKKGTYYPVNCTTCDFSKRDTKFSIPNGVKLYGGFAGTETAISERDIDGHPTYLSGDIDQDGTLANNSFTVVYTSNVSSLTEIDGFIITGGNASDSTFSLGSRQNSGAGWFNSGSTNSFNSSPVVRNCRFENNYAWGFGGGMVNDGSFAGSSLTAYINCNFVGNSSRAGGGAIFNSGTFSGGCSPFFLSCFFTNNECTESDGGAVFNIGSENGTCKPSFTQCTFLENNAFHDGGAVYNFGKTGNSSPYFTDCIFENNIGKEGGAIYNDGTFSGFSSAEITDCQFINNRSYGGDGGAIYNSGFLGTCNPELMACLFENNESQFAGGAIFNNGVEGACNPIITNCRFTENRAITYGGVMYNQGKSGHASPVITNCLFSENLALSAGAVYNLGANQGNANAVFTNCTFYKNNANVCGAVYCNAGEDTSGIASPTIVNCIFWENTANDIGDIFRIINGTPTISYSLVDKADCNDLYNGNGGVLNCNSGMVFNQNPLFTDAAGGNFHLMNGSPAIDFGNNMAVGQTGVNIDLDSLPRISNGTVDFGVYEFGSMNGGAPAIIQHPISQTVCEGASASFSVSATGSQPLGYQWFKDGQAINGANGGVFAISTAAQADAGEYTCEITNGSGTITSQSAMLTVQEHLVVSLSIASSSDTICMGEEITLTASPINGGNTPVFQWYINGNPFGDNFPSFKIDALENGDTITCGMTSSENCTVNSVAFSNEVTIYVETSVAVALSIVPDEAMPCEGQTVIFSAMPDHGGTSPSFQWSVNGNLAGNNSPFFGYIPQQADTVQCMAVSSLDCVLEDTVSSNIVVLNVVLNEMPLIIITPSIDSVICIGTEVTFMAAIEHGGNAPEYGWVVNGTLAGGNSATFPTNELKDGDVITCLLTSSLTCLAENPVLSNVLVVEVDSCMVNMLGESRATPRVLLNPNPTDGRIFVEISRISGNFTTRLLNTHGQILWSNYEKHPKGPLIKQEINTTDFPQGVYYFQIITDGTITTERMVVY